MMNRSLVSHPTAPALLLALASAGTLGAALFFQYVVGLAPCVLCIWQRWPYVAVVALSVLALLLRRRRGVVALLLGLSGLALLVGAAVGVFHVGVEQHWWTGTSGCGAAGGATTLEELRAQVLAAPVVRCDEAAWSLFGVSMAGYNVAISLVLSLFAFTACRKAA
jgi:disulfide bond formation protein DsbB